MDVDFIDLNFPDAPELQQRPAESPSMLFEAFDSSVCPDGSHRVVVTLAPQADDAPGELGLWAERTDSAALETGETVDLAGDSILTISLNGVAWIPDDDVTPETPETPIDEGGAFTGALWSGPTGGSAALLLGLGEASQFRAFTLTDPYRVVIDVRP
ncbi:AMIN-like domain-containing (lipo)protein [Litorihabitans aurantiacus]|uniref:AMIN-like domain-containing (lipo)protein n=1 Tax=Litorihabitans aurantiacus TaxID=1930061 RepID=UPI0024E1325C|nr:hypothetical protein [Litorihabitans aurantiacus]